MAQNYLHEGCNLLITNGTGSKITSGTPVFVGGIKGIALGDIADATSGPIITEGVFTLAKKSSLSISEGDTLYWDATPGEITKTAADGKFIGYAAAAAGSSATEVQVILSQSVAAANVAFSAGSNLVGVDGTGSNAAPLVGTETRLDALDTAVAAILTSLKAKGIMESA